MLRGSAVSSSDSPLNCILEVVFKYLSELFSRESGSSMTAPIMRPLLGLVFEEWSDSRVVREKTRVEERHDPTACRICGICRTSLDRRL